MIGILLRKVLMCYMCFKDDGSQNPPMETKKKKPKQEETRREANASSSLHNCFLLSANVHNCDENLDPEVP